jgi:hypothetical protein
MHTRGKNNNTKKSTSPDEENCKICLADTPGSFVCCCMCLSFFHTKCLNWNDSMVKKSADRRNEFFCKECKSCPFLENQAIKEPTYKKMQQIMEEAVKTIEAGYKSELNHVDEKVEKNTSVISELIERLQKAEDEIREMKKTNQAFTQRLVNTDSQIHVLKTQKFSNHTNPLSNTVHNVPQLENENVSEVAAQIMSGLGVAVDPGHIASCRRVKSNNASNKAPMIVMTFVSSFYRNLVWTKYISEKSLSIRDIFPQMEIDSRVYINLMLSPNQNQVKNEVARLLISTGLPEKFWIRKGKVHVIKSKNSNEDPVPLSTIAEVKDLAEKWNGSPHIAQNS